MFQFKTNWFGQYNAPITVQGHPRPSQNQVLVNARKERIRCEPSNSPLLFATGLKP